MDFQWTEGAIVANDIPSTIDYRHWQATNPRDNSTPEEARNVARVAKALGFVVTGIAAEVGVPGTTEMTLPLDLVEPVTGSKSLNFLIRTVSPAGFAQISNIGQAIALLEDARRGNDLNRIFGFIDILWGEETGDGRNSKQPSEADKILMLPGIWGFANSAATNLIKG